MGSTFLFVSLMLCYHLLAVLGLAQKVNGGDIYVQQEASWQQGQEHRIKTKRLLEAKPGVGFNRPQESKFSLEQGLRNTKVDTPNDLPIDTTEANTITTNSENCQPFSVGGRLRARGGKAGQAPPLEPNLKCPLPVITGTDTPQSGQQQQPPTTGHGGDEREEEQAPGGTNQDQPLVLPNLIRIPMNNGDNPTCYDATYGLMPVGVCQNTQQIPQPSKYDVFMSRNIDIYARAWKLIDSRPAWPGMRECLPRQQDNGIWCCRFYSYLFLWGDICWPLTAIEQMNSRGIGDWQREKFNNPLILPP